MMPDPVSDQGLTAQQLEAAVAEVLARAERAEATYQRLVNVLARLVSDWQDEADAATGDQRATFQLCADQLHGLLPTAKADV